MNVLTSLCGFAPDVDAIPDADDVTASCSRPLSRACAASDSSATTKVHHGTRIAFKELCSGVELAFNTERGVGVGCSTCFDQVRVGAGRCSVAGRSLDEAVESVHRRRRSRTCSVGGVALRHLRCGRLLRTFLLAPLLSDLRARALTTDTCRCRG